MKGLGLVLSSSELTRAQERIASNSQPWQSIAETLLAEAEKIAAEPPRKLDLDTSWFDSDPTRDFAETYKPFHNYAEPARLFAIDINTLALAARLFGRDDLAKTAIERMQTLLKGFSFHVRHHDSGMSFSSTIGQLIDARYLLDNFVDAATAELFNEAAVKAAAAIKVSLAHWLENLAYMPYNNHLIFQNTGLLSCAVALGDEKLMAEALDGVGSPGYMMVGCTTDDGMCYESSTLYHYATTGGLIRNAEISRHTLPLGRNIYDESYADGRTLKQMLDAPLGLLMPDGQRASFGDCYANRPKFIASSQELYELGYAIWKDPRYAWLINRHDQRNSKNALLYGVDALPAGTEPDNGSKMWPEHGWALISSRSGSDYFSQASGGFTVVMNGDKSCVHHHRDNFTIQLCADNTSFIGDMEIRSNSTHAFSDPIQEQFNRAGWAHNLLVINGQQQNQTNEPLQIIRWRDQEDISSVAMADYHGIVYDGVKQMRCVSVSEQMCLDVYWAASDSVMKTADWYCQPLGDNFTATADFKACDRPENCDTPAMDNFQQASFTADKLPLKAQWANDGKTICMQLGAYTGENLKPAESLEMFSGSWEKILGKPDDCGRTYFARVKDCREVVFVALHQLGTIDSAKWSIEQMSMRHNGSERELHIKVTSATDSQKFVVVLHH